jgi:beta-phosphoglucomutase-like phosphatase (HAD superfamily)
MSRTGWAALFDLDGLLVDSEPVWLEVEREVFARLGADRAWTSADQHSLVGGSIVRSAGIMVQRAGSDRAPAEVVDWLVDGMGTRLRDEVRWKPGARELLAAVRSDGAATALVSSSYRVLVDAVLARLPEGSFDASVAGDEVSRGKPEPDPYLRALALLDVPAAAAVVLEDSPTGALAGTAAGCRVVVVPDQPVLPDGHPWVECGSLTEVTPARLRSLLGRDGGQHVEVGGPARREDGREHPDEG